MSSLRNRALVLPVVLFLSTFAHSQDNSATVGFTLDFQGANPSHYEISIASDGRGSYSSNGQLNQQSEPADPAPLLFTISDSVRLLRLARRSKNFAGGLASTATRQLPLKLVRKNDKEHAQQIDVSYPAGEGLPQLAIQVDDSIHVPAIQELTSIFQGLSTTLEFGRRLTYFRKYEKLALDDDLKRMEQMQRENNLGDLQAISPVLQGIADDRSVMNVSRARALRLLALAGK